MGTDKRLLCSSDGRTLLDRAIDLLRGVVDGEIVVVLRHGEPAAFALSRGVRCLADPTPFPGPLAAIGTGLRALQAPRALVLAVDMPLVSPSRLARLVEESERCGADMVVMRYDDRDQPFPSVVSRSLLSTIYRQCASGSPSMRAFVSCREFRVRRVEVDDTRDLDQEWTNVNDPDDWTRAAHALRQQERRIVIPVLLFAVCRELTGCSKVDVEVNTPARTVEVLDALVTLYPRLAPMRSSLLVAVNHRYASPETRICAGDEVAVLPPVCGG